MIAPTPTAETGPMKCPKDLIEWVNSDPRIVFFLYDIDLLPEQVNTKEKVCALRGFKYGWTFREKADAIK